MLKPDRFSCSQKIWLKQDPPVHSSDAKKCLGNEELAKDPGSQL